MAKFVTNASSAIWWPKLEPILIALHAGQIWNQFWWHFWWSNFELFTSGTTYNWPNLEIMQMSFYLAVEITPVKESIVKESIVYPGSVVPLAMFLHFSCIKMFTWSSLQLSPLRSQYPLACNVHCLLILSLEQCSGRHLYHLKGTGATVFYFPKLFKT